MVVRGDEAASHRLDEIYRYSGQRWGEAQADRCLIGLFEAFERIEAHQTNLTGGAGGPTGSIIGAALIEVIRNGLVLAR